MAVASDGSLLVNAFQLATKESLDAVIRVARESGLSLFVGLAIPPAHTGAMFRELDDATADIVGRLGPKLARRTRGRAR